MHWCVTKSKGVDPSGKAEGLSWSATCVVILATLGVAATSAVSASEIYKWIDDNGIVHYDDRPSGNPSEQVIEIGSGPSRPAHPQARTEPATAAPATDPAAAGAKEATKEELRAQKQERAEKCTMYKERLEKFVTSRRLYRQDDNGQRVYLDEEETRAARAEVQDKVLEYCDS